MCEPTTIAALSTWAAAHAGAISLASTALTIGGQVASHMEQNAYAKTNANAAMRAYEDQTAGITQRQIQEQNSAAQRTFQNQREYAAARATAVVGAEDAGVRGISVDALLNDLAGQQHARQDAVDQNTTWAVRALQDEKRGAQATRDARILSVPKSSTSSLLIKVGGTALQGLDAYNTKKKPRPPG